MSGRQTTGGTHFTGAHTAKDVGSTSIFRLYECSECQTSWAEKIQEPADRRTHRKPGQSEARPKTKAQGGGKGRYQGPLA